MSAVAFVSADGVAVVAGGATITVVLLIGAAGRGGPQARPAPAARSATTAGSATERAARAAAHRRQARVAGAVAVVAAGGLATGPAGALLLGLVGVVLHRRRRARSVAAVQRDVAVALPDAIELLVLSIHAGRSPTQAVIELTRRAPSAVRPGFVAVERRLHRGHGLADALSELPRVLGPPARELAATIATADREGLPLTPTLDRLAHDARAARRRQGEAAIKRLPVQLSFPLVTCVLPAFVLLALAPAVLGALSSLRGAAP